MTLLEFIESKGFERGVYGGAKHSCGLPHGIKIKPDYSPIDGSHTLIVSGTMVKSCVCPSPWGHNDWRVYSSRSYNSPEELAKIIEEMSNPEKGCWD